MYIILYEVISGNRWCRGNVLSQKMWPKTVSLLFNLFTASEEYRWFNQGFQRHCPGNHTWSWDSSTGQINLSGKQGIRTRTFASVCKS